MALVEYILRISEEFDQRTKEAQVTVLLGGYAIATIEEREEAAGSVKEVGRGKTADRVEEFLRSPGILYAERSVPVFQGVELGRAASCIRNRPSAVSLPDSLSGEGVLVGIVDSGIDYTHPDFRNEDGTTRIAALWDQTPDGGRPPEGYPFGTLFTKEEINAALREPLRGEQRRLVPGTDPSGHGTHVAGIAAGNGRASGGQYRGVAYRAELLVVKLAEVRSGQTAASGTARLMEAVDFCIRYAMERDQPLALNLSYGTSEGAHNGQSLLEAYLNTVAGLAKCVICVGTGNEGIGRRHAGGRLERRSAGLWENSSGTGRRVGVENSSWTGRRTGTENSGEADEKREIELAIEGQERSIELELWKSYVDEFSVELVASEGERAVFTAGQSAGVGLLPQQRVGEETAFLPQQSTGVQQSIRLGRAEVTVLWTQPTVYQNLSCVRIGIRAKEGDLGVGIWQLRLLPEHIVDGVWDIWILRGTESSNSGFVTPEPFRTLTIPSTAENVISVGAYDSGTLQTAPFSGRGTARESGRMKPDLVAPGVDILSCAVSGGYTAKSGTSMATPFVTGGAALLMEWGIIHGNDPYLYGERLREYLLRGAVRLPGEAYPNPVDGWGRLCVNDSLPG